MLRLLALSALLSGLFLSACSTSEEEAPPPAPFTEMYMVGDATPVGWNIQSPQPLTRDSANPYLWHWEGMLFMGELKFPTYKGTWSADYFMPLKPAERDLGLTTVKLVLNGTPDNKWLVTDSTMGTYRITLDTRAPSIRFRRLPD